LEVAPLLEGRIPPHPAHGRSWGRGGAALVRAMLDEPHARSKVGKRLAARGRVTRLQPGLTRAARHEDRVGHLRAALGAAHRPQGVSAVARTAREVSAIAPPWRPQAPTTMMRSGAYADEPKRPETPHPASGPSPEGRDARKQVRRSRGGAGRVAGPCASAGGM